MKNIQLSRLWWRHFTFEKLNDHIFGIFDGKIDRSVDYQNSCWLLVCQSTNRLIVAALILTYLYFTWVFPLYTLYTFQREILNFSCTFNFFLHIYLTQSNFLHIKTHDMLLLYDTCSTIVLLYPVSTQSTSNMVPPWHENALLHWRWNADSGINKVWSESIILHHHSFADCSLFY